MRWPVLFSPDRCKHSSLWLATLAFHHIPCIPSDTMDLTLRWTPWIVFLNFLFYCLHLLFFLRWSQIGAIIKFLLFLASWIYLSSRVISSTNQTKWATHAPTQLTICTAPFCVQLTKDRKPLGKILVWGTWGNKICWCEEMCASFWCLLPNKKNK